MLYYMKKGDYMRISEYLKIGNKMKTARTTANISQRSMATKLGLTFSTYSNYENSYSEPPMEVIEQFCDELKMSIDELFEFKISEPKTRSVKTFSEFLSILIDLDRRGLPIKGSVSYSNTENKLIGYLNLELGNAQIATFIPDWNKVNSELESGLMDEDDYKMWLEDTLSIFNVPIDSYI